MLGIVHYRAWTKNTQHKFEDTWQEQQPIELVLGKGMWLSIMFSIPLSLVGCIIIGGLQSQLAYNVNLIKRRYGRK